MRPNFSLHYLGYVFLLPTLYPDLIVQVSEKLCALFDQAPTLKAGYFKSFRRDAAAIVYEDNFT